MKFIDLHTHSTFSDGTLTPTELVVYAYKKGLSAIALTDHDTIHGLPEAAFAASNLGIKLVTGVEISVIFNNGMHKSKEFHLLGLGFDPYGDIATKLEELENFRKERNKLLIKKFAELDIDITLDEVLEISPSPNLTKAHFAQLLVKKGYANDQFDAFTKYFSGSVATNLPKKCLTPNKAIDLIHSCGGIAVLAHPLRYGLKRDEVAELITILKSYGLDAIEAIYSTHDLEDELFLRNIAKKENLGISGGSDYHGELKKGIDIGIGRGELEVSMQVWDELQKLNDKYGAGTDK